MAGPSDSALRELRSARAAALALGSLLGLGASGIAVGCDASGFRSCEVDRDCRSREICVRLNETRNGGRCARRCESDSDCERPGTTCQPFLGPGRDREEEICLSADVGSERDAGNRCTSDEDCENVDAGPAVCGINGRCILVELRRGVRLVDRSDEGESGGDGAEIAALYLEGENGEPVAFGRSRLWCRGASGGGRQSADTGPIDSGVDAGSGPVDAADAPDDATGPTRDIDVGERSCTENSPLDGTRPDLDEERTCIAGPESETTRLGVGGELLAEFVDADGGRVPVGPNHRIVVLEWGRACDAEDDDEDRYDLELCTSRGESLDPADCQLLEGDVGSGRLVADPNLSNFSEN